MPGTSPGMTALGLRAVCGEGVAGRNFALREAGHEPALALLRRAVGEGVRHHAALRTPLQSVVADRGCRLQRGVDVARLEEAVLLFSVVGPHAGEAVRLQFDAHLDLVGPPPRAWRLLRALRLLQNAEFILHVVADLMRDHIGLRKFAGFAGTAAEALFDLPEEGSVQIDALIGRTIEWAHRRLGEAATATLRRARKQNQPRRAIG